MRMKVDGALVGVGLFVVLACGSSRDGGDGGQAGASGGDSNLRGGTSGTGGSDAGGSAGRGGTVGNAGEASDDGGAFGETTGGASGASDDGGASGESTTGGSAGAQGGSAGAQGGSAGAQGGSAGAQGGSAGSSAAMLTLTIEFIGDVPGEVVNPLGFSCSETCTRTLPRNHEDTYRGRPENGTGTYFAGFGGDCAGIAECAITMDEDKHVTVEFREQTHNFVFLASRSEYPDIGGAEAFDESCNELATSAGINNATNDAYVAWISDDDSLAPD